MATASFKGDFMGFTFNNIHSSDYNIVITSGGNRFNEDLLPSSQDSTVNVPGGDGSYFFDSFYQPLKFSIKIAYDNLSESDIRNLRRWLGTKEIYDLIFDENPYKVYSCKVDGQPKLQFICFDNADKTARVYKGEGDISFVAYYPFARARYKSLDEYPLATFPNRGEWATASGITQSRIVSGSVYYDAVTSGQARLYNPGDMASPLTIPEFAIAQSTGYLSITYQVDGSQKGRMILDMSKLYGASVPHYYLDSERKLILGYDNVSGIYTLNNKVYNNAIVAGDFIQVQPQKSTATVQTLTFSPSTGINIVRKGNFDIDYNYLYL